MKSIPFDDILVSESIKLVNVTPCGYRDNFDDYIQSSKTIYFDKKTKITSKLHVNHLLPHPYIDIHYKWHVYCIIISIGHRSNNFGRLINILREVKKGRLAHSRHCCYVNRCFPFYDNNETIWIN